LNFRFSALGSEHQVTHDRSNFDTLGSNIDALNKFWRRQPFHDMGILDVRCINKRVIVWLEEFILVCVDVEVFVKSEFPTEWLYETIEQGKSSYVLSITTTDGTMTIEGKKIRLIRTKDLSVLIPSLDRN
jgi:hypothetical protein